MYKGNSDVLNDRRFNGSQWCVCVGVRWGALDKTIAVLVCTSRSLTRKWRN